MKIALTLSGGGYRAAAFSLGTLSLISKLRIGEQCLLDYLEVLSTVSGGTITGARYALSVKRGESFDQFYENLYSFLADTKLVEMALENISSAENWQQGRVRSLIASFADVYDQVLFKHAKFGELMDESNTRGIKHLSFNATEFANALQFRFQWSEKIIDPAAGEPPRGIIGNFAFKVPEAVAKEIRLADIMAASSCFPGGFEPINFPTDFILDPKVSAQLVADKTYPVGLMDGGIVDNQGIQPVMLAKERMYKNHLKCNGDQGEVNLIDLVIISDVASPNMDDFKASKEDKKGWWKKLTPRFIININLILFIISLIGFGFSYYYKTLPGMLVSTVAFTTSTIFYLVFRLIGKMIKKAGIPEQFLTPLAVLKRTKLYIYQSLLMNRIHSLLMLTMTVFLKHVRRMNYNSIYVDNSFMNRRIMSAVYELKSDQQQLANKVSKSALDKDLLPSEKIQKNSDTASAMGTTLWFSPEELKSGMLKSLIACGQYTMCWNLLEYIGLLKKDSSNTGINHRLIIDLEDVLKKYWNEFQLDPLCMVNKADEKNIEAKLSIVHR